MTWQMEPIKTYKPQAGFTLVELMIALAIMAFGVLGYTFLQARALQGRVFAREMGRATIVAQSFLEDLTSRPYDDDQLADNASDNQPTLYPASGTGVSREGKQWFQTNEGNFRYYTRWEVTAGIPSNDIKLIEVYTAWEKKDPDTGTISLGGYNTAAPRPTLRTFMRNHD